MLGDAVLMCQSSFLQNFIEMLLFNTVQFLAAALRYGGSHCNLKNAALFFSVHSKAAGGNNVLGGEIWVVCARYGDLGEFVLGGGMGEEDFC